MKKNDYLCNAMSMEFFIARKLHFDDSTGHRMSRPAVRVATFGIAVGVAVIILAVAIIVGFKHEVSRQVIGFGSHIQVSSYTFGGDYEAQPITVTDALTTSIAAVPHVQRIQRIATKPSIVKTDDDFAGVILKGVDSTFDWTFFKEHLIAGDTLTLCDSIVSNDALVSSYTARTLQLQQGDRFTAYFAGEHMRARRFTIRGIYETTFADFDKLYIVTDARQVQRLNGWQPDQFSHLELLIDHFDHIDEAEHAVFVAVANANTPDNVWLQTQSIKKIVPRIFEWLDMLDINAVVILVLMLAVAGFNMVSGLLILILERTTTIGTLKTLGATDWSIRKIFLFQAAFLVFKGMAWGNIVGCGLVALQHFTHIIKLDAAAYYVDFVPVELSFGTWLLVNGATLALILLVLLLPSHLIARIRPASAIKFD